MVKKLIEIPTANMTREEWVEARRNTIGGSDAAAIVGLSKWATPLTVYMDKKGLVPDKGDSLPMWLGREFEEAVAKLWTERTGKKVRRKNAMIVNPAYPFAHANVDRMVVGENAGLECKTTSEMNLKRFKGGEFPENYYVQCVHYLAVTGADRWYLVVLVGNRQFFEFTIERDEEEIKSLMEAEKAFYENHLIPGVMPEAIGRDADDDAIKALYPAVGNNNAVDLTDMREVFNAYALAVEQRDLAEQIIAQARQDIELRLKDAPEGFCGGHKVTWKGQTRSFVDVDKLKEMGIDIPYKTTTYRTFRFTAAK